MECSKPGLDTLANTTVGILKNNPSYFGAPSAPLWTCVLLLSLLVSTPSMAEGTAEGIFGMHYWPQGYGCAALKQENWVTLKPVVAGDLDHLVSLGVRAVRLMFWPIDCGYTLNPKDDAHPHPGGTVAFSSDYLRNLQEMIALLGSRGFDIFIGFDNSYLKYPSSECPGQQHWQCAYGNDSTGFNAFILQSSLWMNGLVQTVEQSPYAPKVKYYDFIDEATNHVDRMWPYIAYMYDHTAVPKGKRGISLLNIPDDANDLKNQVIDTTAAPNQRPFDYVSFNTINDVNMMPVDGSNTPICPGENSVATIQCKLSANYRAVQDALASNDSSIAAPQISLGSFGFQSPYCNPTATLDPDKPFCNYCNPTTTPDPDKPFCAPSNEMHKANDSDEQAQSTYVLNMIQAAKKVPFYAYVHWMFVDFPHSQPGQTYGLLYEDTNSPKAVLATIAQEMSPGLNLDMGDISCTQPANWWASLASLSCQGIYWDTATGAAYGRVTVPSTVKGPVWMATSGGVVAGKRRLFVNFFFRSNLSSVRPEIHEYDAQGALLDIKAGPAYSPPAGTWSWMNYLQSVKGWSFCLEPTADHIVFAVAANKADDSTTGYLDVDAVSISANASNPFPCP